MQIHAHTYPIYALKRYAMCGMYIRLVWIIGSWLNTIHYFMNALKEGANVFLLI